MKKVLITLLSAILTFSSFSTVMATEGNPTITIGDFDATQIADTDYIVVPVSIDKFPEECLKAVEISFKFDTSKLKFEFADRWGANDDDVAAMQYWDSSSSNASRHELANASWADTPTDSVNRDGYGSIIYQDQTKTTNNFTATQSLAKSNVFRYLYFTKVSGATGETTIDLRFANLEGSTVDSDGNYTFYLSEKSQVNLASGTVTFTSTEKVPTDGTVKAVNADGTTSDVTDGTGFADGDEDVSSAFAVGFASTNSTEQNTVTWTIKTTDEPNGRKYVHTFAPVTGGGAYRLGLIVQGLSQDKVTSVTAVLNQ